MAKQLLSPPDRQRAKNLSVPRWIKKSTFVQRRQDVYFGLIESSSVHLRALGGDDDLMLDAVAAIVALAVGVDETARAWFYQNNQQSEHLATDDGWRDVCQLAGGLITEKYLRERTLPSEEPGPFVAPEEVEAELNALLERAREVGRLAQQENSRAGELTLPHLPPLEVLSRFQEDLENILGQETFVAREADTDVDIPRAERDREIAKKALIGLQISDLRDLAIREGLSSSGSMELIADRIAKKYAYEEDEIARLVLQGDEPDPERGYLTRLLPLRDAPDIANAGELLRPYVGHYVKVGVARWIVIREVNNMSDGIQASAVLRMYQVSPRLEYEEYDLASKPRVGEMKLRLRRGSRWLEARLGRGADTRGVMAAVSRMASIQAAGGVVPAVRVSQGPMIQWDPRTLFFLELLDANLPRVNAVVRNLTMARFEAEGSEDPNRPAVTAVRLEGHHIISSVQACQQITSGRGIVSLEMLVRYSPSQDESFFHPLRIELHPEYVTVFTPLVRDVAAAVTTSFHEAVVVMLGQVLDQPARSESTLRNLGEQIEARASARGDVEADILAEVDESTDGEATA